MGEGIDEGDVDGEDGVEGVGEADALGLGDESEESAVGVEAPGAAFVDDFEVGLAGAVEELVADVAGRVFVGEFECVGAVPLDADDGDEAAGAMPRTVVEGRRSSRAANAGSWFSRRRREQGTRSHPVPCVGNRARRDAVASDSVGHPTRIAGGGIRGDRLAGAFHPGLQTDDDRRLPRVFEGWRRRLPRPSVPAKPQRVAPQRTRTGRRGSAVVKTTESPDSYARRTPSRCRHIAGPPATDQVAKRSICRYADATVADTEAMPSTMPLATIKVARRTQPRPLMRHRDGGSRAPLFDADGLVVSCPSAGCAERPLNRRMPWRDGDRPRFRLPAGFRRTHRRW